MAAIIAPLLTAVVNNRRILKEKQLDVFYKEKLSLYKEFADTISEYSFLHTISDDDQILYNKNLLELNKRFFVIVYKIMIMSNKEISEEMEKILKMKGGGDFAYDIVNERAPRCVDLLNKDLKKASLK